MRNEPNWKGAHVYICRIDEESFLRVSDQFASLSFTFADAISNQNYEAPMIHTTHGKAP